MNEEAPEFRYGTPSIDEWDGMWTRSSCDPPITDEELRYVWDGWFDKQDMLGPLGDQFYCRCDCYGDRTEYLEIREPDCLTPSLLFTLQSWLGGDPILQRWRLLLSTYMGPEFELLIYPDVIRPSKGFNGLPLEEILSRIRDHLRRIKSR